MKKSHEFNFEKLKSVRLPCKIFANEFHWLETKCKYKNVYPDEGFFKSEMPLILILDLDDNNESFFMENLLPGNNIYRQSLLYKEPMLDFVCFFILLKH